MSALENQNPSGTPFRDFGPEESLLSIGLFTRGSSIKSGSCSYAIIIGNAENSATDFEFDIGRWTFSSRAYPRTVFIPIPMIRSINCGYGNPAFAAACAKSSSSARIGFGFASMK